MMMTSMAERVGTTLSHDASDPGLNLEGVENFHLYVRTAAWFCQ